MDTNNKNQIPPTEELLKKIHDLEESHAHLKQEMSKLKLSDDQQKSDRQRSSSVSPRRPRRRNMGAAGGVFEGGAVAAFKMGSSSFRHSSPLRRETRSVDVSYSDNVSNNNNHGSSVTGGGAALGRAVVVVELLGLGYEANGNTVLEYIAVNGSGCAYMRSQCPHNLLEPNG
ncbi:hypothetical protein OSB04_009681 [Centaurea solstitialis]|uniref:Uncharacterized protein n=1 Tax=Centaurea solstitialis TaxID=347529 RepID=A0AA38WB57_9ASTR|nr:hypothetical protein OSB04_009681 [Centaurea solstitialis]